MSIFEKLRVAAAGVRFRGPERDRATDAARLGALREAVSLSLVGIDAEIEGLARRREEAMQLACGLVGTADAQEYGRDPDDEAALVAQEDRIKSANARLEQLKRQRAAIADIDVRIAVLVVEASA